MALYVMYIHSLTRQDGKTTELEVRITGTLLSLFITFVPGFPHLYKHIIAQRVLNDLFPRFCGLLFQPKYAFPLEIFLIYITEITQCLDTHVIGSMTFILAYFKLENLWRILELHNSCLLIQYD